MNEPIISIITIASMMIVLLTGFMMAIIKASRMKKYLEYARQIEAYAKFAEQYEKVEL